jgi:hypothetical protein
MAAKAAGKPCPDYQRMHEGFKLAYTEMARQYPCFGFAAKMPNIDWWRMCVKDSFVKVMPLFCRSEAFQELVMSLCSEAKCFGCLICAVL